MTFFRKNLHFHQVFLIFRVFTVLNVVYDPFFTRKNNYFTEEFLDDAFFYSIHTFRAHPTTLLLKILGGTDAWAVPHLKFREDRPPSPPLGLRPCCSERLDQLAFDCRMSLDYLQGYSNLFCTRDSQSDSYPVIGWARSASWSCSGMHFQLVTMQFGTMTWLTVIL